MGENTDGVLESSVMHVNGTSVYTTDMWLECI